MSNFLWGILSGSIITLTLWGLHRTRSPGHIHNWGEWESVAGQRTIVALSGKPVRYSTMLNSRNCLSCGLTQVRELV